MLRTPSRILVTLLVIVFVTGCNDDLVTNASEGSEAEANACAMVQASPGGSPGDIASMNGLVAGLDQAWTTGDAVTYAANYAAADWVGPNGAVLNDAAAIEGLYVFLFSTVLAETTRQSTIRSLTFLSGTIAVLDIDTQVTGYEVPPPGVVEWAPGIIRAREKNILVKRGGEWQIVKHQQVLVAPGVP